MKLQLVTPILALVLLAQPCVLISQQPLTFRTVAMGQVEDTEATKAGFHTHLWDVAHFGITSLRASDGTSVNVQYDDFDSPEEATRFLEWKVGRAARVLSRGDKTDAHGKVIGQWVAILLTSGSSEVEVIWIIGANYHCIYAPDIEHAQELEQSGQRRTAKKGR